MNRCKALCGHLVVAAGAPHSKARKEIEETLCRDCRWDAQRVREELPEVLVKIGNEVHKGKVYGRKLGFASISITASHNVSAAWETVAHCLNHNRPIIIE